MTLERLPLFAVTTVALGVFGAASLSTPAWSQGGPPGGGGGGGGGPSVEAVELDCNNPCVNSFELEDGAVGTDDLANDAVTSAKIAAGAVGTSDLADGSVTEAKLSFVPSGVPLQRVVYVSGQGIAANNGSDLVEAMGNIGTSGPCSSPGPEATSPCLVKLGPGVFDVSGESVETIQWVDIAGSGQNVTTIFADTSGVVRLAGGNAEIRNMTVEFSGNPMGGIGVGIGQTGNPQNMRISQVTVRATSTTSDPAFGIGLGGNITAIVTDAHVTAAGAGGTQRGIEVGGSGVVELNRVHINSDNQGMFVTNTAYVTAHGSVFQGDNFSIIHGNGAQVATADIHASRLIGNLRVQSNSLLGIATSQVDATTVTEDGSLDCVYAYDQDFNDLDANCM